MISQRSSCEAKPDDANVLIRLREGDPEAWHAVAVVFRQRLRDLAASTMPAEVSSRADASDMVQQTMAEANESFAAFRGSSLPELFVWLTAILNHNVVDAVRQHLLAECRTVSAECPLDERSPTGVDWDAVCAADQTSPSMVAARSETHERLCTALESLPPRQRLAVRLRHLEGRPLTEIAADLGCTVPAAAVVIARGLRALRESLRDLD